MWSLLTFMDICFNNNVNVLKPPWHHPPDPKLLEDFKLYPYPLSTLRKEDPFGRVMGGLHIEQVGLRVLGGWLEDSGWVEALTMANIATSGRV